MRRWSLVIILIVILLLAVIFISWNSEDKMGVVSVSFNGVQINAEVADTSAETEKGLMYRESLGNKEGMLFIFEKEKETSFWMKNTLIPLDMIFLNENKEVVNIVEGASPCNSSDCILYPSEVPVKYVIEVNAGFVEENGIEIGDKVEF